MGIFDKFSKKSPLEVANERSKPTSPRQSPPSVSRSQIVTNASYGRPDHHKIHSSQIADKLRCVYCATIHETDEWPLRGDYEAVYFGEKPGKYSLQVTCPRCHKDWYVYWYEDPGPIRPLDL